MAKVVLAEVLKEKGLSKRQFAKRLDVDYASVFRYFRPAYDPKLSMLERWAIALEVPMMELIVDESGRVNQKRRKRGPSAS